MFHTLDICQSIAEKLQHLNQTDTSSALKNWEDTSLVRGWPSLALFYSILDAHLPNQKFDQLAHEYLALALSRMQSNGSLSLVNGTAGLCFTVYICSQGLSRYKKLLPQLEQQLIEEIKVFLQKSDRSMNDYNLLHGISGVLAYLLLRQNDQALLFYGKECLSALVHFILNKKNVAGHLVPNWYEESFDNPYGRFTLNSLNGIAGILSTLALASLDRLYVEGLHEAILTLAEWLKSKQKTTVYGPMWPAVVSFEEEIGEKKDEVIHFPNIWYYGSAAISRSLYLAYKAVGNRDLQAYAETTFLQTLSPSYKNSNPSFGFGKAGLLAMTYRMFQDTSNRSFFLKVNEFESALKNEFNPNSLFGFQTREIGAGGEPIDDPGILNGAIGTALTLLLVAEKQELNWDRLFLVR